MQLLAHTLPFTVELTLVATLMGVSAGIPLGVLAATRRNQVADSGVRLYSLVGYAVPDFYLGALLLITFSLNLGWFPINGGGGAFWDRMYHIILPAMTLAFLKSAFLSKLTRTSLLEVFGKDYVRTARAKGARENRVIYRHALRNALLPLTTGLGLSLLATLSGSVAIELVFNRPGLGTLLISAIGERDYAVIQGGIIVFALFVVVVNLAIDLALYRGRSPDTRAMMPTSPADAAETLAPAPGRFELIHRVMLRAACHDRRRDRDPALRAGGGLRSVARAL